MITAHFNLRNPFSKRWECLFCKSGSTLIKNKFWEVQIDKCADLIGLDFRFTTRQDHAGLYLSFSFLGYDIIFQIYDNRHWNDEENRWYRYDELGIES